MSNAYKNSWRGYLIDHHSPDPPIVSFENLDLSEYEACFRAAHLDMLMQYTKDHWGVTYYPSKVEGAKRHPGLKLDLIAEMKKVLQRNKMEFMAYYSVGFDTRAATTHPDWACRHENGEIQRVGTHPPRKWHLCCGNTGYRDYVLAQLSEVVGGYRPDTVFIDIFHTPLCWCSACAAKFRERYGRALPKGEAKEKLWRELLDWHTEVLQYEFFKAIRDTVKALDPKVALTLNGGHISHRKQVLDLCDYTYAEPWAGCYVSAAFARGTGVCPQIGPGGVSQVYNPNRPSVFVLEAARIVAQGVRAFMFSGSQHPDGTLDHLEFEEIGAAYSEIESFQSLLAERESVKCVGVVYSENSRVYARADDQYTENMSGAVNGIAGTQFPFDVIPEWRLTPRELNRFQAVVVPNMECMSEEAAAVLRGYVKAGGRLLITFRSGTRTSDGHARGNFALAEVVGCDFDGLCEKYLPNGWGSYMNRLGARKELWDKLPDTELALSPPFVQVRPTTAEVLATHLLPTTVLTDESWVNWWAPPWREASDWPALTINRFGKGLAIYCSVDLFRMERTGFRWVPDFLSAALEWLIPRPVVRAEVPARAAVGTTYFVRRGSGELIVHQVNQSISELRGDIVPVEGGTLVIDRGRFDATAADLVHPTERPLKTMRGDGVVKVKLPKVEIHNIIVVQLSAGGPKR